MHACTIVQFRGAVDDIRIQIITLYAGAGRDVAVDRKQGINKAWPYVAAKQLVDCKSRLSCAVYIGFEFNHS